MAPAATTTRRGCLAAGLAAGTLPSRAQQGAVPATETVLPALADATIFVDQGGGSAYDATADGRGANLWTSVIAAGVIRRALLRFDLTALPPGAQIVQARLEAFAIRIRTPQVLTLHRLLEPWGEGGANGGDAGIGAPAQAGDCTWSHRVWPDQPWSQRGGVFEAIASASAVVSGWPAPLLWPSAPPLVADVQRWLDEPTTNHGWLMRGDETGQQNATRLASRDSSDLQARPRLVVHWLAPLPDAQVPLPPWALALFGLGAAAALLRRRRSGPG